MMPCAPFSCWIAFETRSVVKQAFRRPHLSSQGLTLGPTRVSDVPLKGGHHAMAKKKRDRSATEAEQPTTEEPPRAEKPEGGSKRGRTAVPHEELVPGTVLTATLKGKTFSAAVVLGPEGKSEVEFEG